MNDTVTIIASATGSQIAKAFRSADYQPLKLNPGSEFWFSQQPIHDLQSLASVIGELEAEALLDDCLTGFFSDLSNSKSPRLAVRITMGTGKTTKAIEHLKQYLALKHGQNTEVYVPRHDLADEWEKGLDGINAKVVHIYPRTGGKWDEDSWSYPHPIMCHRAD